MKSNVKKLYIKIVRCIEWSSNKDVLSFCYENKPINIWIFKESNQGYT